MFQIGGDGHIVPEEYGSINSLGISIEVPLLEILTRQHMQAGRL